MKGRTVKMNNNLLASIAYVPTLIQQPRVGLLGQLLDRLMGPKVVRNPDLAAGKWVGTFANGSTAISDDCITWSPIKAISTSTYLSLHNKSSEVGGVR